MPNHRTSRSAALLLLLAASVLGGCNEQDANKAAAAAPPPPEVTVANPEERVISDFDEYVGRFVAVDNVEVRARVSGYLDKIHFNDGQMVKAGDTLFTIDRRPFEAAAEQARAALVQAEANQVFAENNLKRGNELVRGTTITQQTFDQRVQEKRVADAAVAAQRAAVKQAELDLDFTELKAPVSGRVGDHRVSVGNLVTGGTSGNTTLLATIVSLDPIRFEFTIDEGSYLQYLTAHGSAGSGNATSVHLPVTLKLIDEDKFGREGHIDFVDNSIDRSSGTIRLRAEFDNPDRRLTPGMFGRIKIARSAPASALLIPDTAIGTELVRKYVYVIGSDNVAQPKYVTPGPVVDGLRVIKDGLAPTDVIVVNGLMRVRPGAKVTPQRAPADTTADAAQKAKTKTKTD